MLDGYSRPENTLLVMKHDQERQKLILEHTSLPAIVILDLAR